tara:strand:+ start:637 stop:1476 length:840 start_codon:yes stop_codon:yes gene_type:complete
MKIFKENLKKNLTNIGIKKGDTVYLGINLGKIFASYSTDLFSNNENINSIRLKCSKLIFETLKNLLGQNGTIIVPTFSFSFLKLKNFHFKKTPSTLGYFENFFLKENGVQRSKHPIYSISAWGKNKKILEPCGNFSFGVNSPFSNFLDLNVKFLNIGNRWVETCTYVHHLEHLNGINHRFYKPTTGIVNFNGYYKTDTYYNPVRFFNLKSKKAEYKIEKYLIKGEMIRELNKSFYCSLINSRDIYHVGLNILKTKPYYFMSKKTICYIDRNDKLSFKIN